MRRKFTHCALILLTMVLLFPMVTCTETPEISSQPVPDVQWSKTMGGSEDDDDARSVQQTTDGGYIVCGFTSSKQTGSIDCWLIRMDTDGNKLWQKILGSGKNYGFISVKQTSDGGYIVCGTADSGESNTDGWLLKTDDEGNKLWEKNLVERRLTLSKTFNRQWMVVTYCVEVIDHRYLIAW